MIWVIGLCMILMAGLVFLPVGAVGALGAVIVAAHNLMDGQFWQMADTLNDRGLAWLWKILYFGFASGPIDVLGMRMTVLYSLIPWIGVMALGYAFGPVMVMDAARRRRWCFAIGGVAIALFLLLRGLDLYGDPGKWNPPPDPAAAAADAAKGRPPMPPLLRFLNTNKYPASLLFLLMTLGPMIAVIPLLETAHGALARVLIVYGRVPFFYYVLHIPLIHLAAIAVSFAARRARGRVALRQPPDGQPSPARRVHVGTAAALPGHVRGRRDPVRPVPLDGRAQGAARATPGCATCRPGYFVTWRGCEPSAFITQISIRPVRSLWKAMRLPSGNHAGTSSW